MASTINAKNTSSGVAITPDSSGQLELQTADTTRLTIDSSGNVGIGTTSPNYSGSTQALTVNVASGYPAYELSIADTLSWHINADGGNVYDVTAGAKNRTFYTDGSERMRIDSSGNLLVGTTTLGGSLTSGMNLYLAGGGTYASIGHTSGTSNGQPWLIFSYGGTAIGSITQGSTASTNYNTASDYRLKENWQPMTGATERLMSLNPVNFAWKADGSRVDGFLAHEAQEVVPEAVTGTKDAMRTEEYEVTHAVLDDEGNVVTEAVMGEREVPNYQGIDQSKLVPLLTAALQEAIGRIETLEAKVAALEEVSP